MNKNKIYSLEEAGTLAKREPTDFIKLGSEGAIPIYVSVPDDVVVYGTNTEFLELADPAIHGAQKQLLRNQLSGVRPVAVSSVEFLRLTPVDCMKAQRGEYSQAVFLTGLQFDGLNNPKVVAPPEISSEFAGYEDFPPSRRLACYSHEEVIKHNGMTLGPLRKIRLTLRTLRVIADDIDSLLSSGQTVEEMIPFDDGFVEKEYMSKRLITMHRAAIEFWDPNRKPPEEPTNDNVARWIEEEYRNRGYGEYGSKLAKYSVGILRDSYENWNQIRYEENRSNKEFSKFDALKLMAEEWKGVDLEKPDDFPIEIEKDLIVFFGFSEDLAKYAVKMLKPEKAWGKRVPKTKK